MTVRSSPMFSNVAEPSLIKAASISKLSKKHMVSYGGIEGFKGYIQSGLEVLEEEADIMIPAAMEMVIDAERAPRIKTPLIIEAANGPITAEADNILSERGVVIIPDLYANAGGVTVSYFEWIKNLSHIRFGRLQRRATEAHFAALIHGIEAMSGKVFPDDDRSKVMSGTTELVLVSSGLEDTMVGAYENISKEWNENTDGLDMRLSTMKLAIQRVVSSYGSLGI